MPSGNCNYPQHHNGPSAGQPVALAVLIVLGAVIISQWRTVLACVAVVAVLALCAAAVVMLWHAHRSEPYDAVNRVDERLVHHESLAARVVQLERQLAERPAVEAPAQHLHLHGISPDELTAYALQRHQALEQDNPHP